MSTINQIGYNILDQTAISCKNKIENLKLIWCQNDFEENVLTCHAVIILIFLFSIVLKENQAMKKKKKKNKK
jgi:Na+/alanine symporter